MANKSRKHYTPSEKMKILKAHLIDHKQVSDVCDQYQISPSMFYRWQQQLFENGTAAFECTTPSKQISSEAKAISELKQRLILKDNVIAEITQEFIAAKKKIGDL